MVIRHDLYEALSLVDSVSESGRSMGSVCINKQRCIPNYTC